jgi:hypothetical protein
VFVICPETPGWREQSIREGPAIACGNEPRERDHGGIMKAMVWMVATTIGGAVGWWIGAFVGIFTAVSLSALGSGVALFYAQRLANEYLP